MLGDSKAFSGFAVDDLAKAKAFYEDTLGLKTSEDHGLMTLHLAGDRPTIVYPKPGHEPANYTILNFPVDDIDAAVRYYSPGSGSPFGDKLDELRALAGGAKLSIDVLPVCSQGGDKKSAMPEKRCNDLVARLEARLSQLSGHV